MTTVRDYKVSTMKVLDLIDTSPNIYSYRFLAHTAQFRRLQHGTGLTPDCLHKFTHKFHIQYDLVNSSMFFRWTLLIVRFIYFSRNNFLGNTLSVLEILVKIMDGCFLLKKHVQHKLIVIYFSLKDKYAFYFRLFLQNNSCPTYEWIRIQNNR